MSLIHDPYGQRESWKVKYSGARSEIVENGACRKDQESGDVGWTKNFHKPSPEAMFWMAIGAGIGFITALLFIS